MMEQGSPNYRRLCMLEILKPCICFAKHLSDVISSSWQIKWGPEYEKHNKHVFEMK